MRGPMPQYLLFHLEQGEEENLEQYYNRTLAVLSALHGRGEPNDTLTAREISLRAIVVLQLWLSFPKNPIIRLSTLMPLPPNVRRV